MISRETELEMVRRHIREGEGHLADQRAVIDRLTMTNHPTEAAEALLATFESVQRQHEAHFKRVMAEEYPSGP